MSDLAEFYESMTPYPRVGRNGYTKTDRYRDFVRVFSTDEGRRVMAQIIDLCEGPPVIEHDVESHAKMAFRAGRRWVGLEIVRLANQEPREPMTHEHTED